MIWHTYCSRDCKSIGKQAGTLSRDSKHRTIEFTMSKPNNQWMIQCLRTGRIWATGPIWKLCCLSWYSPNMGSATSWRVGDASRAFQRHECNNGVCLITLNHLESGFSCNLFKWQHNVIYTNRTIRPYPDIYSPFTISVDECTCTVHMYMFCFSFFFQ